MDAKQNLYDLQMESCRLFKDQDVDNGDFDVTFMIDGNKLYAHKHRLTTVSPTFRSMLSDRWTSKDAPIDIKDYSFESFKEFLLFIYSGSCSLTEANIFTMVDIAEFYGVGIFKNECDKFISKIKLNLQNILQFIELSEKYLLIGLKCSLKSFIMTNFGSFIKSEQFQLLQKSALKNIIRLNFRTLHPEELFEQVFKWAESRAIKKQKTDGTLILNGLIKNELADILPFMNFSEMDLDFVVKFVGEKPFLFPGDELSNILRRSRGKTYVKIFDENGNIMKGLLNCPEIEKVCTAIESQKNVLCTHHDGFYWPTAQTLPSASSKFFKNVRTQWYLVYDKHGNLYIKSRAKLMIDDYLLAEMYPEAKFERSNKCKIEVYRG